ncbi:MAG: YwiC-like family protein [Pyrinomonadaceae bacterium]|nr:YwiC-like family protein [Acidobacteriota bacterium]MBK7932676.1 YwiC-like family protein [Acidobacteriota bacterium]MBP7375075.1 YwiC-like family protein [Pyrinomonadaceae bacterium]
MSSEEAKAAQYPKIRAKSVALPVEHGSWGFLFEPLVAGIAVAPAISSVWIAVLVIGAFLMRHPMKVILAGGRFRLGSPQVRLASKFLIIFALVFLVGAVGSIWNAQPASFIPFAVILPFAAYQIYCDATRSSRQLLAELIGSVAISSSIAVIALAAGWETPKAYALWAIVVARLIPSILYVRNRLYLEKGKPYSHFVPIAAHILALAAVLTLAVFDLGSYLPTMIFAILFLRSVIGLSSYRKKVKAMKIGIWEVIYGTLVAVSIIVGHYIGI